MPTSPPSITPLPSPPDPSNRSTFNALAYPWSVAQQTLATEIAAVAENVFDNASEAATAAVDAQAAGAAAAASANSTKWVAGNYDEGAVVWSPANLHSYRRNATGASATDPSADAANWTQLTFNPTNTPLVNPTITNYTEPVYAPAAGAAFVVDLANGSNQVFTTNANCTITLPAPVAGKSYTIDIKYGGAHTVTWAGGGTLRWPNGTAPTVTSVNGKRDSFAFTSKDAVNTHGSTVALNYAA